jgi:hypothetical protein
MNFEDGANLNKYCYDLDSVIEGCTYKNWAARYWQAKLDEDNNKTADISGACYSIKHGSVVFLANPFAVKERANYNCTFDTTNSFFFPLYSEESDYAETKSDEELNSSVTQNNKFASGRLIVDGFEITGLSKYHFTTDFFDITYGQVNPYNAPSGTYRALVDGLFIFLKPFSEGKHELKYSVAQATPDGNNFSAEITYKLDIKGNTNQVK